MLATEQKPEKRFGQRLSWPFELDVTSWNLPQEDNKKTQMSVRTASNLRTELEIS